MVDKFLAEESATQTLRPLTTKSSNYTEPSRERNDQDHRCASLISVPDELHGEMQIPDKGLDSLLQYYRIS